MIYGTGTRAVSSSNQFWTTVRPEAAVFAQASSIIKNRPPGEGASECESVWDTPGQHVTLPLLVDQAFARVCSSAALSLGVSIPTSISDSFHRRLAASASVLAADGLLGAGYPRMVPGPLGP